MYNPDQQLAEAERVAYISGDISTANLLAGVLDGAKMQQAAESAKCHIDEAKCSIPQEDFLQDMINDLRIMARERVTKAQILEFAQRLEDFQDEMARTFEYIDDELKQAIEGL